MQGSTILEALASRASAAPNPAPISAIGRVPATIDHSSRLRCRCALANTTHQGATRQRRWHPRQVHSGDEGTGRARVW